MPTTYTHWRFGDECIATLPQDLQDVINRNREIFDFGVHGPDIFFYYNCLKHNDVNQFGTDLHDTPFRDTLEKIRPRYQNCDDKEAALSYLLGFCAHFTLDSYCHGYIDRKTEVSDLSHGKIESQYDRYLLELDGYDPVKKSVTFSLKPGNDVAHVIWQIFPEHSEEVTRKALKDMLFYLNLLKDSSRPKRWFLNTVMDAVGVQSYKDLMLTEENDERCKAVNERLMKLSKVALRHFPLLALSMVSYLNEGKDLDPYFHNHFCPKEDYKDIPILDYEEELKHEENEFQK
ncbi:MAG: zinc dependent phospholipase C family protein [Erysipelotrichaceae bacterium]|nr:zinc dependent phospholipase C family protein [Erysipelotrichaceae bacterium]